MRVFSQINNSQQKQNKCKKQTKQKGGSASLGLAKSIYYFKGHPRILEQEGTGTRT